MDYHFNSISKGLIDTSDIIYFLSIVLVFNYLTVESLKEEISNDKKLLSLETPVRILLIIGIAILLNIVFSYLNFAIDLSEDKNLH